MRFGPGSYGARRSLVPCFRWSAQGFSPGQGIQSSEQGGLIVLHREHEVCAKFHNEAVGVRTLSMRCIGRSFTTQHL
jgi:hypothetical protein